jgi:hypothetical protein
LRRQGSDAKRDREGSRKNKGGVRIEREEEAGKRRYKEARRRRRCRWRQRRDGGGSRKTSVMEPRKRWMEEQNTCD